jgi:CMP-N-acetylneuraminic acid synthetase
MTSKYLFIGLIPARKGSKGLKNKNMLLLNKKPLVQHTFEAAKSSSYIDEVWASSDDLTILSLADSMNIKGLKRPKQFANDQSSSVDVVNHFIDSLPDNLNHEKTYIVYLQPTSPLRDSSHLDEAINQLIQHKKKSLTSVMRLRKSPFKSFMISESGNLQSLFNEQLSNARRQDLQDTYVPNGAIYIFTISEFLTRKGFPSNGSLPFIMSSNDSIDIDDKEDLKIADNFLKAKALHQ